MMSETLEQLLTKHLNRDLSEGESTPFSLLLQVQEYDELFIAWIDGLFKHAEIEVDEKTTEELWLKIQARIAATEAG